MQNISNEHQQETSAGESFNPQYAISISPQKYNSFTINETEKDHKMIQKNPDGYASVR